MIRNRNGQTLIEVIIAIAVVVIVIASIAVLAISTLRTAKASLRRAEALRLAKAGIDAVQYVRDTESCGIALFDPGVATDNCYSLPVSGGGEICSVLSKENPCQDGVPINTSVNEEFMRKIEIMRYGTTPYDQAVQVRVTVSWNDSGSKPTPGGSVTNQTRSVMLSQVFSAYR